MKIKQFEQIQAWQLTWELTQKVYHLTKKPEFSKDCGLKTQIRNTAGSSMHNIAKGFDVESTAEFIRFVSWQVVLSGLARKSKVNSILL